MNSSLDFYINFSLTLCSESLRCRRGKHNSIGSRRILLVMTARERIGILNEEVATEGGGSSRNEDSTRAHTMQKENLEYGMLHPSISIETDGSVDKLSEYLRTRGTYSRNKATLTSFRFFLFLLLSKIQF